MVSEGGKELEYSFTFGELLRGLCNIYISILGLAYLQIFFSYKNIPKVLVRILLASEYLSNKHYLMLKSIFDNPF